MTQVVCQVNVEGRCRRPIQQEQCPHQGEHPHSPICNCFCFYHLDGMCVPYKAPTPIPAPARTTLTEKVICFTVKELQAHDQKLAERTYRTAAIATLAKLEEANRLPVLQWFKVMEKYFDYLEKEYKVTDSDIDQYRQKRKAQCCK